MAAHDLRPGVSDNEGAAAGEFVRPHNSGDALVATGQQVEMAAEVGQTLRWSETMVKNFAGYWSWVPLTLGLVWWVSRCPLDRAHVVRWLGQMLAAAVAVVVLRAAYVYTMDPWFHWYPQLPSFGSVLVRSLGNNFLLSWLVIGTAHAFVYFARVHRQELKVAALESSLAGARLDVLTAQLNPHFLVQHLECGGSARPSRRRRSHVVGLRNC